MVINHEVITDNGTRRNLYLLFTRMVNRRELFDWERQETTVIAYPRPITDVILANVPNPF